MRPRYTLNCWIFIAIPLAALLSAGSYPAWTYAQRVADLPLDGVRSHQRRLQHFSQIGRTVWSADGTRCVRTVCL
jgi:hypothetical protein